MIASRNSNSGRWDIFSHRGGSVQSLFPKKTDLMAKQCAVLHKSVGPVGGGKFSILDYVVHKVHFK